MNTETSFLLRGKPATPAVNGRGQQSPLRLPLPPGEEAKLVRWNGEPQKDEGGAGWLGESLRPDRSQHRQNRKSPSMRFLIPIWDAPRLDLWGIEKAPPSPAGSLEEEPSSTPWLGASITPPPHRGDRALGVVSWRPGESSHHGECQNWKSISFYF